MLSKQITLVRHPPMQTLPDTIPFIGRSDFPAEQSALKQSAAQLKTVEFDAIISSPATRCRALAQLLADVRNSRLSIADELQERDFGDWDGVAEGQIAKADLQAYYQHPFDYPIANAETLPQMQQRVHDYWAKLLTADQQKLLVITHGGVMRLLLQQVLNFPEQQLFQIKIDYGCQITFEIHPSVDNADPFVQLASLTNPNI